MPLEQTIKRIQNMKAPANEEAAKISVVGPILEELGWDYRNVAGRNEVEFEQMVKKSGNKTGRLDIALLDSSKNIHPCVCFIEVKAPNKILGAEYIDQVVDYSFYQGVNLCILTNTKEWMFFSSKADGVMEDRMFLHLDINADADYLAGEFKQYLKRSKVILKGYDAIAKKKLEETRKKRDVGFWLPELWKRVCEEGDTDLLDLIVKKAMEEKDVLLSHTQISSVLFNGAQTVNKPGKSDSRNKKPKKEKPKRRLEPIKLSHMILNGGKINIDSYKDMISNVVISLYGKYKDVFIDTVNLEWEGKTSPISRTPTGTLNAPFVKKDGWPLYIRTHGSGYNLLKDSLQLWEVMGEPASGFKAYSANNQELVIKSGYVVEAP